MKLNNEPSPVEIRDLLLWFDRIVEFNKHQKIIDFFGNYSADNLIKILVELLNDLDPVIRKTACEVLIHIDYEGSSEKIALMLNDKDENVRYNVSHWLLQKPNQIYFDYLVKALKNNLDPDVRSNAAMTLGEIGDERALEDLFYVFENDEAVDFQGDSVARTAKIAIDSIKRRKK